MDVIADGLARLDAEAKKDDTPIEAKIEEVASAMGLEDEPPKARPYGRSSFCLLHACKAEAMIFTRA